MRKKTSKPRKSTASKAQPKPIQVRGAEVADAVRECLASFKPRKRLPLSEWMAAGNARLDDGSKFRAFPFQNGIADAFTDPDTSQISVRKSSRIGYSTIVQGYVGYSISTDPRRLLIYQPTIDDAENYSKDDLEPVLQWPSVRAVATFKPRHRDNQIRAKRFKGGWIQIKGANSPKEFRRVTADSVLLEEPDGYPWSAKEEGDPARLAFKRNLTSPRRFSAAGSTPKIKGWSRIDALFEQGTQEYRDGRADEKAAWQAASDALIQKAATSASAADRKASAAAVTFAGQQQHEKDKIDAAIENGASAMDALFPAAR